MQTERVTRSRARTMAAGGDTPSLAAMPDKTPATRTTRRRAAAAATAPPAASSVAPCTTDSVQPVVLFDVTNDQDGEVPAAAQAPAAVEPAAEAQPLAAEESAGSEHAAEAAQADEPPATPAHSASPSPATLAPGATPTGLGLSTLPPMSPMSAMASPASTPAATPLSGVQGDTGRVSDALHAAVQALGGNIQVAAAPALPAEESADLVFRGFGSPVKVDSPERMSVSIGGAVCPASAPGNTPAAARAEQADATSAATLAGLDFQLAEEREVTLEEMMGTPPSDREESPEHPTPSLRATAAAAGTPVVRTAPKPHPLTPSRQVVLEEEEQDYIMQTTEEEAQQAEAAEQAAAAAASDDEDMAEPSPVPQQAAARVQSKVVVPSPHTFDPRSLRQLKREVADRMAAKLGGAPPGLEEEDYEEEDEEEEFIGAVAGNEELTDALGALSLETGVHHGLRGVPTPAGKHTRFDEEGEEADSPRQRVYLRGMPQPAGSHVHFDD